MSKCEECRELRRTRGKPPYFRPNHADQRCYVCGGTKTQVLDLHHTAAVLCSIDCETTYWLDIFN